LGLKPLPKVKTMLHTFSESQLQAISMQPDRNTQKRGSWALGDLLIPCGDAFTLQQILGHSSLDMVKLYVNLFRSDIQEQHRKFSPVENIRL
jgi:integrase